MAEILNLRTARKRAERRREDTEAAANRVAHGVPAADRQRAAIRRDKAAHDLSQHEIEKGNGR